MTYSLSVAQDRRTKAQFAASNPTPSSGQLCIETDSGVYTTGDGSSAYLTIRGNSDLSGSDRQSADDVYAAMGLGDSRDEVGEGGGGGAVDSVNGATGVVVLEAEDIDISPFFLVTNAGYIAVNGTYRFASVEGGGQYNRYQLKGGVSGDYAWHDTYLNELTLYTNDIEKYRASGAGADLTGITSWAKSLGVTDPDPTVSILYEGTQQDLDEVLAGCGRVTLRTGSTIAFDTPAVYNTPAAPTSSAVTFDLSGAVNCEVVAYFNNAAEPTWPANVYKTGLWNNGALNTVRFIYIDALNIGAEINSNNFTGNIGRWSTVVKMANTNRTNTATLAADPDLVVPMLANKSYRIRGTVVIFTSATPDFKYRFTGPAAPGTILIRAKHINGLGTAPTDYFEAAYSAADKVFLMSGTAFGYIELDIYINNGANAGNFAFEWAQNTSDAGNIFTWTGSYFDYMRVN